MDGAPMIEHTGNYAQFAAATERKMVDGDAVAHLDTIGATWFIFHGPGLVGYTAAQQGSAGGDVLAAHRDHRRPITYWTTPEGITQLAAWRMVIAFVTAKVDEDLAAEWSDAQ